ncbi:hypothetical protein ACHAPD_007905 [Fusarium lateritium]
MKYESAVLKEQSTCHQEDHPWKKALSYLSDDDRVLIGSIDTHDNGDKAFADVQDLISKKQKIWEEKAWKITFGGRRIVLRDVLAKIASWLDSFKAIGDLVLQIDPIHAGIPWTAIRLVLSAVIADNEQMGLVIIGLEQVICIITRCSIYQQLYLENVEQITEKQALAVRQLSEAMAHLVVRTLKSFCHPSEIAEKLKEVGNLETRVTTEANVCQGTIAQSAFQRIDENSQDTRQSLRDIASLFDGEMLQLWKHLNEDERCKILQWVSDIPYESDHYIARKGRVDGTGEWLIDHEIYTKWHQSSWSTLLWLNGIPGAGKTKLSSRVVDDLLARLPESAEENSGFAYFYCDRNRPDHNEPVAIMRSIIRQLCTPRDSQSIESCVENQYLKRKIKGFSSDRLVAEECKQLLVELVAGYRCVYIVVDGLDECDRGTRHILMDLLDEIIIKFEQSIKVYIASRTDQDLRKRYPEGTHLEVTANDNQADIEKFVLSKLDQSEFCRTKLSQKLRNKILSTFQHKSQGMFQWATLHIGELIQLERNADIAKYLDGLPKGLEAAYDKIYAQISNQTGSKRNIAFAAFQIVMVSQRPLHPFELAIAAAQDPSHEFILDKDVDIGYVLEACQNLLVVSDGSQERNVLTVPIAETNLQGYLKEEIKVTRSSASIAVWENVIGVTKDSICRFAHLSVQEYLETRHLSSIEAHAMMAGICLRTLLCLSLPDKLQNGKEISNSDYEDNWTESLILRVSQFKKRNIVKIIPIEGEYRQNTTAASFPPSSNTETIQEVFINNKRSVVLDSPQAVYDKVSTSSALPLAENLEETEKAWAEVNGLRKRKSSVLQFGPPPFECYVEHVDYHIHDGEVETCLCQTFEPFLEDFEGSPLETWTIYCSTFLSDHLAAIRDCNGPGIGSTLLGLITQFLGTPSDSTTSYRAWIRLAQNTIVLDDPDPSYATMKNVVRPYTSPALGCIVLGVHEVLNDWLDRGKLDPGGRNLQGDSLLDLAVRCYHTDVCKVLLKHGADPNLPHPSTLTSLGVAVRHGDTDLVHVLVDGGADLCTSIVPIGERKVGWRGLSAPQCDTPVHEAVKTGNADLVKAIIDGAKSTSYHGRPIRLGEALNQAAVAGREDLAALLLFYDGNQDGDRQVMIHNALDHVPKDESGINIMKYLMGLLKRRTHGSLLHTAIAEGRWTFAEALITTGVGINTPRDDLYRETPLHSVFRQLCGDESAKVRKLIDWGANVNARDIHGNTPLALAMMTKIFDKKKDDDREDKYQDDNDTTIDEPILDTSRLEAIRYLLQRGANTNEMNRNGMSLLGIACVHAIVTPEVIEMLLDHGADVNAIQGHGEVSMSPLDILHLHETPSDIDKVLLVDAQLVIVKQMLEKHGARHILAVDYENWDIQTKISWIQDHRTGLFDVANLPINTKFSIFTQELLAVPALTSALNPAEVDASDVTKRENCKLTLQWKSNWREGSLRRYRVQLITAPREDSHLSLYCSHVKRGQAQLSNIQCYWRDGMYVIDFSDADGPAGYVTYKRVFSQAGDVCACGTGCQVVKNL